MALLNKRVVYPLILPFTLIILSVIFLAFFLWLGVRGDRDVGLRGLGSSGQLKPQQGRSWQDLRHRLFAGEPRQLFHCPLPQCPQRLDAGVHKRFAGPECQGIYARDMRQGPRRFDRSVES